jgi:hypothetical protein
MVNGSAATVADLEVEIEMPHGAAAFKMDLGALGVHIQLACSPSSTTRPIGGCTLFAPGRGRKIVRQSYNLSPGETATSLRMLVPFPLVLRMHNIRTVFVCEHLEMTGIYPAILKRCELGLLDVCDLCHGAGR